MHKALHNIGQRLMVITPIALTFKTFGLFLGHDGPTSAGNLAFLTMLSLFPAIIFLVALSGFLGQTEAGLQAVELFLSQLPTEVSSVLEKPIKGVINNTGKELLTGSVFFILWGASGGVEAARGALIKLYGREHRPAIWRRRLESIAIVIIGAICVLLALTVQIIGPALLKLIGSIAPDIINSGIQFLWTSLSVFLSPALLFLGLYGIYFALTPRNYRRNIRWPGAVLALAIFLSTARGLSTYLSYAGSYDVTYGSLAGIVIAQIFCFFVALGFILGGAFNATLSQYKNITASDKIIPEKSTVQD